MERYTESSKDFDMLKHKNIEKVVVHSIKTGPRCIYKRKTKGYIGLMCPKCFYYTIRNISIECNIKLENIEGFTNEYPDTPELLSYPEISFIKRTCDLCSKENATMIAIDPNIVESISILNRKGFLTLFSCEGHTDNNIKTGAYIMFKNNDIMNYFHTLPITWEFDVNFFKLTNLIRIYSDSFNYKESIIDLKEWIEMLPIIK